MNRNRSPKTSFAADFVSILLALLIGISLFLALRNDFDGDIGHFAAGSPFFCIFTAASVTAVLFALFTALLAKKKDYALPAPLFSGIPAMIAPLAASLSAMILFVMNAKSLVLEGGASAAKIGELVFLPGIAAFFILGILPAFRGKKLHCAAGIAAALSVNILIFNQYFDFNLPLNSPIRNAILVMEGAYLLALLFTTGSLLGRNSATVCHFIKRTTVALTGGIALGLLLAAWLAPESIPNGVSILRCVLCLFSAAAMLSQSFTPAEKTDD